MYDRYHVSRCDAMEFLAAHYPVFPDRMPDVRQVAEGMSCNIYKGWRFFILDNGSLVFADCLSPCITKSDLEAARDLIPVS